MHLSHTKIQYFLVVAATLILGACAGSSQSVVPNNEAGSTSFRNFLVIAVTGDYNSRAQFERMTVAELRRKGAVASAYYSIAGGNVPVSDEAVLAAIQSGDFDAVLVIRALDVDVALKVKKSRTEIDATPLGGRIVNLFRSDYTDYKTPGSLDLSTSVIFAIELYSAASEEIVWSMDHSSRRETNLGLLIDKTAATIVERLYRDKQIDR